VVSGYALDDRGSVSDSGRLSLFLPHPEQFWGTPISYPLSSGSLIPKRKEAGSLS
jgi:hypothetical protein